MTASGVAGFGEDRLALGRELALLEVHDGALDSTAPDVDPEGHMVLGHGRPPAFACSSVSWSGDR
jgi:hypothetical protein